MHSDTSRAVSRIPPRTTNVTGREMLKDSEFSKITVGVLGTSAVGGVPAVVPDSVCDRLTLPKPESSETVQPDLADDAGNAGSRASRWDNLKQVRGGSSTDPAWPCGVRVEQRQTRTGCAVGLPIGSMGVNPSDPTGTSGLLNHRRPGLCSNRDSRWATSSNTMTADDPPGLSQRAKVLE